MINLIGTAVPIKLQEKPRKYFQYSEDQKVLIGLCIHLFNNYERL